MRQAIILAGSLVLLMSSGPTDARQIFPVIVPPAGVPVPPPVAVDEARAAASAVLMSPTTSVLCGGETLKPLFAETLAPDQRGLTLLNESTGQTDERVALDFSISDEGRPLSIRPASLFDGRRLTAATQARTEATLAAWTFPRGARPDCRLTIQYTAVPLALAEPDLLLGFYASTRPGGELRKAVEAHLRRPGDDCVGLPRPRTLGVPDFAIGSSQPGSTSWTALRWNVSADGSPREVETVASSGDEAFDAETRRAVEASTFRGGAKTGCLYNYWRTGPRLAAPSLPMDRDEDSLQNCPPAIAERFQAGRSTFPDAFHKRRIEGWALVRFDLASWGQVGNVQVIEAQPAATFGEEARRIVQLGRATPGFEGAIRCVVPVRFKMPEDNDASWETAR